jgi:hypothetical protein
VKPGVRKITRPVRGLPAPSRSVPVTVIAVSEPPDPGALGERESGLFLVVEQIPHQ